jgi:hypothetical protein
MRRVKEEVDKSKAVAASKGVLVPQTIEEYCVKHKPAVVTRQSSYDGGPADQADDGDFRPVHSFRIRVLLHFQAFICKPPVVGMLSHLASARCSIVREAKFLHRNPPQAALSNC